MVEADIGGDQLTLEAHLRKTSFLVGVEEGRWRVLRYEWPYLVVRAFGRGPLGTVHAMDFRLECLGYSAIGPFAETWDDAAGVRPPCPGDGAAPPSIVDALKQWNETGTGYGGIYRPWQRGAAAHNDWANKRPDLAWHSRRDLTFIMEQLYALASEQASWLDYRAAA